MRFVKKHCRKILKRYFKAEQHRCSVDLLAVFEAISYIVYTGCQWKMLPRHYPAYTTVYHHFRIWTENGILPKLLKILVRRRRKRLKKKSDPSVAIIDSQSVRSDHDTSIKGIDGNKKIKGIKRQIAVDSNGYPLVIEVTTANVHDSKGAKILLHELEVEYPSISLIKADKGYCGIESKVDIQCVKSNYGTSEFLPLAGRWVVERTLAWLEKYRRLARNYEQYLFTAKAMAYFAAIAFMMRYG